jgi:hypothetical protein
MELLDDLHKVYIEPTNDIPFEIEMSLNRWYKIVDERGQHVFSAGELVDVGSRCWRGMGRRYCMYIFSASGHLLFTSERQRIKCCSRLPPTQEAVSANMFSSPNIDFGLTEVLLASGEFIGRMHSTSTFCRPKISIDERGYPNLISIEGNKGGMICPMINCKKSSFKIYDAHNYHVGSIKNNVLPEGSDPKGTKCVEAAFPQNISQITKALIIAAAFELKISYMDSKFACESVIHFLLYVWMFLFCGTSAVFILWSYNIISFK